MGLRTKQLLLIPILACHASAGSIAGTVNDPSGAAMHHSERH
jgi:hypothetical protein